MSVASSLWNKLLQISPVTALRFIAIAIAIAMASSGVAEISAEIEEAKEQQPSPRIHSALIFDRDKSGDDTDANALSD